MHYKDFTAEDFARDAFFIRWVKSPDAESDWFWNTFMHDHPAQVPAMEVARKIVSLFDFYADDLSGNELAAMRNRLVMALHAEKEREKDHTAAGHWKGLVRTWLKAAAIIAVPLLCLGVYSFLRRAQPLTMAGHDLRKTEYRTDPKGQKSVLLLNDGTKVWLNTDSRLSYAKDFATGETRSVYLEGEAFFDVASDPSKPFIVHTSALNVKVLGTAFNVKAYGEEKTIETTLVHGQVCIEPLQGRSGNVILKPNQKAVFTKALNSIDVEEVNTAGSGAWRQDRLVFDEVPFDHVILELERWYNVRIHIKEKGKLGCRLTADIRNESIEDFLDLLQGTHKIEYFIDGNDVFIKGNLCDH